MDSSEMPIYSDESDEFLHPKIEWQNFPLMPRKSEEHPKTSKDQHKKQNKRKRIAKQPKQTQKKPKIPKKQKDQTNVTMTGRPKNKEFEQDHLEINRSYNDIVYHFSRMMIFLKLKQGIQTSNQVTTLQNNQSVWISQTQKIMSHQNFPAFQKQKPVFLLHPNSLHYVFHYYKQNGKDSYNDQEIKYMLFAFLIKREMLTSTVYHYINSYWGDIVYLLNNPQVCGQDESESENESQIEVLDMIQPENVDNQQNINNNNDNVNKKDKKPKTKSQIQLLKNQLHRDDSIAAYQIVCYLHFCCLKFEIQIGNSF